MKKGFKIIIPVLLLMIISAVFGIILSDTVSAQERIYEGISVNGVNVGGMTKEEAKKVIEEKFNKEIKNKKINIYYENNKFVIDYKTLKAHYDVDKAVDEAFKYGKDGNIIEKTIKRYKLKNDNYDIKLQFVADTSVISKEIKTISKKINTDPIDAKITLTTSGFKVTPDKNGKKVDEKKLEDLIKASIKPTGGQENINVPVNIVEANIKAEMLSKIDTKISSFTTKFNLGDVNRSGNIKVASSYVNGAVVMPGEVFSMNKTLGPRSEAKGYKEAPVIINGTHVPGLAGGICQVTTTVYNAALLANFPILERRPHQLRVGYVPAGRDATISGDVIDMKFKNTNKYPIYIKSTVNGGSITVTIYGANEHPGQTVQITSEILEKIPAETEYVNDPTLVKGQTIVEEKPTDGMKSITYRKVYQNGKLVKSEIISKDYYKPGKGKVRVGTKEVSNSQDVQTNSQINNSTP
ncbi:VanW family protein [Caloramator sp. E03]|uniref:VanW family protein n=1 Tax=Caloramator sp. E03 TaxID=2576307 RepID=UPI00143DEDA5|nr:VanW family protein [Caloramator sp. E03]